MADDVEDVVRVFCVRCGRYVGRDEVCLRCAEADDE